MRPRTLIASMLTALALAALAQEGSADPVTVAVAQSETYGPYLTGADGMALYLFVNEEVQGQDGERMTEGVRAAAAPCAGGCLEAWPPLLGEVTAGEGVDAELLYTADVNGAVQAVYNGWPLYYFARDAEPGQTNGQGVGGPPNVWYLVGPDGGIVPAQSGDASAGGGG